MQHFWFAGFQLGRFFQSAVVQSPTRLLRALGMVMQLHWRQDSHHKMSFGEKENHDVLNLWQHLIIAVKNMKMSDAHPCFNYGVAKV